jgi:tetratricopeptide (TPR) repeat protein
MLRVSRRRSKIYRNGYVPGFYQVLAGGFIAIALLLLVYPPPSLWQLLVIPANLAAAGLNWRLSRMGARLEDRGVRVMHMIRRSVMRRQYGRARRLASLWTRLRPEDSRAWEALYLALRESSPSSREQVLRRALSRYPAPRTYYWLGHCLAKQGRSDEAMDVFGRARDEFPASPVPYIGLAESALQRSALDEAGRLIDQALEHRSPTDIRIAVDIAGLMIRIPERVPRAVELLREALALDWRNALPHIMLAALLADTDPDAAAMHRDTAIQLSPVGSEAVDVRIRSLLGHVDRSGHRPP